MNKLFTITAIIFVLFIITPLHAQKAFIGAVGGLNMADLEIDAGDIDEVKSRNTISFGGLFGYRLAENLVLQTEPKYLVKGGTAVDPTGELKIDVTNKYLEVPVLLQAEFAQNRLHVLAGPTLGYMFSTELETEISGFTFTGNGENIFQNVDVGIVVGAGVNFPIWKGNVFLDGRYSHGLIKLAKNGTAELESDDIIISVTAEKKNKVINKGFQIMLGYAFPINWK
jgi:hypothetical protein